MGINEFIQVGNQIRKYRLKKGLSQKEMAKLADIPYSTYSNYENNNREPNSEQLRKIADALGVSIFDIMNFNSTIDLAYEILDNSKTLDHIDLAEKIGNIAKQKYQEKYPLEIQLIAAFDDLNDNGKQKAVEQVELLTKIPEYQKEEDSPDQDWE